MRVLLLGGTGNLGLRLLPALLAHSHVVVAYVRSKSKLVSLISPRLAERITIHVGDALDTRAVEAAIREHECDAIMHTAGNHEPPWRDQVSGRLADSVSSAAVRVGRDRGKPLRAWFIGGLGSLVLPFRGNLEGERWQAQDYMPAFGVNHHRLTEVKLKAVKTEVLEWSLLCVAFMYPRTKEIDVLERPVGNRLVVKADEMIDWQGSWIGNVPVVGRFLELMWGVSQYSTYLDDVADLIAEDLASGKKGFVGRLVGMKDPEKMKAKSA